MQKCNNAKMQRLLKKQHQAAGKYAMPNAMSGLNAGCCNTAMQKGNNIKMQYGKIATK